MTGRRLFVTVVGLFAGGLLAALVPAGPAGGVPAALMSPGLAGSVPARPAPPGATVDLDGDGLDEIGVFAVETRGEARGAWFQLYRADGTLVTEFFLEPGLTGFQVRRMNLDADPLDEVVILAVDPLGDPLLEVRDGDGTSLGRQRVAETDAVELVLFELEADGTAPAEIGIGYSRPGTGANGTGGPAADPEEPPLGPGLFEVWSVGSAGGLALEGGAEVIPDGFANPEWRALDADGDGAQEIVAGYTQAPRPAETAAPAAGQAGNPGSGQAGNPGNGQGGNPVSGQAGVPDGGEPEDPGSGAVFRVVAPDGSLIVETTAADDALDGARWVVGDFLAGRPGDELLVGLRRKEDGAAVGRLFDPEGGGQVRSVQASPAGVDDLTWGSVAGPLPAVEDAGEPAPQGPAPRQLFVGFRLENGSWDYRVWHWPGPMPVQVGGGTILGAGVEVREWLTADFDGNRVNGGEVVVVFTFRGNRSTHFQTWSREGRTNLGAARLFDGTFIEVRARATEAVVAGRHDLLVAARSVGEAPELGLWDVNGSGKLLLDQRVLNRNVR